MRVVELRSDTFTKPTKRMLEAITTAEVGDSQYDEDPTIIKLEKRVAEIFGKERAMFTPSGTMANLAAIMVHCNERGSEVIIGDMSHFNLWEQGGISQVAGAYVKQIENLPDGTFDLKNLEAMIPDHLDRGCTHTKVICIENTHNWCGGKILPLDFVEKLHEICERRKIKLHMDGSRVMTAAVASNMDVKELCKHCDSINFCLSKGVGAPIGSILIGSNDFIEKALRARQVLGGGLRQAGILAAACLVGLEDMHSAFKADIQNAKQLASGLDKVGNGIVKVQTDVQTNIVHLRVVDDRFNSDELIERFKAITEQEIQDLGQEICVKVGHIDDKTMRLLTHLDVNENDIELAIKKIGYVCKTLRDNNKNEN